MAYGRGFNSPRLHHNLKSQPLSVGIFFARSPSVGAVPGHCLARGTATTAPVPALFQPLSSLFSLFVTIVPGRYPSRQRGGNDQTQCLRHFPGSRWVLSNERVSIANAHHSTWLIWSVRHKPESCQILPNGLTLSYEHNEHIPTRYAQVLCG